MLEENELSVDEQHESLVKFIEVRIEDLHEILQEGIIEETTEDLLELEDFSSRKKLIKKNLTKYIEIKNELKFCIAIKKQIEKSYDNYLMSLCQPVEYKKSLGNFDLDSIPDPRLWEE